MKHISMEESCCRRCVLSSTRTLPIVPTRYQCQPRQTAKVGTAKGSSDRKGMHANVCRVLLKPEQLGLWFNSHRLLHGAKHCRVLSPHPITALLFVLKLASPNVN